MLKLNFSYTGQTLLRDWWKQVKAHFGEVENYVNSLETRLDNSVASEIQERKNADKTLSDGIDAEAAARSDADTRLYEKLDNKAEELSETIQSEENSRQSADAQLGARISAEATARRNEDSSIRESVNQLAESVHKHENYSVLAGISADDVAAWRDKTDYESANVERMDYLEEVCRGIIVAVQSLYGASGVSLFDGGVDGSVVAEPSLDGGNFEENTAYEEFDCGTFETDIFAAVAVVDGGNY